MADCGSARLALLILQYLEGERGAADTGCFKIKVDKGWRR
jgi:hypothetical protein